METALVIAAIVVGYLLFDAILDSRRLIIALVAGGIAAPLTAAYAPTFFSKLLVAAGVAGEVGLAAYVWLAPFLVCCMIAALAINVLSPNKRGS
jgi:hypothetical protein